MPTGRLSTTATVSWSPRRSPAGPEPRPPDLRNRAPWRPGGHSLAAWSGLSGGDARGLGGWLSVPAAGPRISQRAQRSHSAEMRMIAVVVDDETDGPIGRMHPVLPRLRIGDARGELASKLPQASADDIAAIFYTSGSTGQPKGAHHDQRNLIHHAMLRTNSAHIGEDDRILLLFAPAAPVAQQDIFSALLSGARLFIVDLRRKGLQEPSACYAIAASLTTTRCRLSSGSFFVSRTIQRC